jgi:hypothetical protein
METVETIETQIDAIKEREPVQAATYTKLLTGDWGLRLKGFPTIKEGDEIEVTTRAGAVRHETVGQIFWTSDDGNISIAKKGE